jgi:hypothetical protein
MLIHNVKLPIAKKRMMPIVLSSVENPLDIPSSIKSDPRITKQDRDVFGNPIHKIQLN